MTEPLRDDKDSSLNPAGSLGVAIRHYRMHIIHGMLLLLLLAIIFFLVKGAGGPFNAFATAMATALFGAVSVSYMTHIGVVIDTKAIARDTTASFDARISAASTEVINTVSEKIDAKYKFGLQSVEEDFKEGELFEAIHGARIYWLNTKFHEENAAMEGIEQAIANGNRLRILLMADDSPYAVFRGAFTSDLPHRDGMTPEDAFIKDPDSALKAISESIAYYQDSLRPAHQLIRNGVERIRRELEESGAWDENDPQIELRFYTDPAGMPMLLVERANRQRECFSGFYLNSYSRKMPYIRWFGPDAKMVQNLFDYFEKKWLFASGDFPDLNTLTPSPARG